MSFKSTRVQTLIGYLKINTLTILSLVFYCLLSTTIAFRSYPSNIQCGLSTASKTSRFSAFRIVGGTKVNYGEFPWQASMTYKGANFCGGSIISNQWILTAAHCFGKRDISRIIVNVGSLTVNKRSLNGHKVMKVIIPSTYNAKTQYSDLALVKVYPPFRYRPSGYKGKSAIAPICLPKQNLELHSNEEASVTGFGRTRYGKNSLSSNHLLVVKLKIQPDKVCEKLFSGYNRKAMLCCGVMSGGKDACQGDSGGPLVKFDRNGIGIQIGIVSYGHKCGEKGYPGVYTRLSHYVDWIHNGIAKY